MNRQIEPIQISCGIEFFVAQILIHMGIETRNGREYFYRKRREGNRVISEYVGGSFMGLQFYVLEKAEREETKRKRRMEWAKREKLNEIDNSLNDFEKSIGMIIKAYLVGKGFTQTKSREWRYKNGEY